MRSLSVLAKGDVIEQVTNSTFLGFELDSGLTWSCHINKVCNKLATACFALKRLARVLPVETVRACYFASVHAHLQYGVEFWAGAAEWERVFRLQKRAVRAIARVPQTVSAKPIFKSLGILTLPSLLILQMAVTTRGEVESNPISNESYRRYKTRSASAGKLPLLPLRLAKSKKLAHVMGRKVYNHLPSEIVAAPSASVFRTKLKIWLVEQAFYNHSELFCVDLG